MHVGTFNTKTTQANRKRAGFSLMELIGVMAVTAILASVILPSLIRQVQIQAAKNESAFLDRIGRALEDHLRRNKTFPDETTWTQAAASEMGVPVAEVLESPQQSQRLYVIDPALRLGTANGTLPFSQTSAGSTEPVSPRVMILTSMDGTKPIPLSSGVIDQDDFEALWTLPTGSVPTEWSNQWQGSGENLKVHRINLTPLFQKVFLNNYDSTDPGKFSIEGGTQQVVPSTGVEAFFVEGTVLGLHDSSGNLVTRQILNRFAAFTYERDTWRGQVHQGLKLSGDEVYNATTLFALSASNSDAQAGATPGAVIDRFTDFMNRYVEWDTANFPGNSSQIYDAVIAAQAALADTTSPLIYSPPPSPTVTIELHQILGDRIKWKLTNTGTVDATIDTLTVSWPGSSNLNRIRFDGSNILTNTLHSSPATVLSNAWNTGVDRTLYAGESNKVLVIFVSDEFPEQENQPASDFDLEVNFEQGGSVSF